MRPLLFFYRSDEQLRIRLLNAKVFISGDKKSVFFSMALLENIVMLNNLFIVNTEDIYQC